MPSTHQASPSSCFSIWSTLGLQEGEETQIYGQNQAGGSFAGSLTGKEGAKPHTRTPLNPKLKEHHTPCTPTAAPPIPQSCPGTLMDGSPWEQPHIHGGSFAVLLPQWAEHQHPDVGSGRGPQGQPHPSSQSCHDPCLDLLSRWQKLGCKEPLKPIGNPWATPG